MLSDREMASMESGRDGRSQLAISYNKLPDWAPQWSPVVMAGVSRHEVVFLVQIDTASMESGRDGRSQPSVRHDRDPDQVASMESGRDGRSQLAVAYSH
jgi:hypothetical protein